MSQSHEWPNEGTTGTPRWVKVFGIIVVLVLLVVVVHLFSGGSHGPGRHIPAMQHGGQQP